MNPICRGFKRSGEPCRAPAQEPGGYCWAHSPEHAAERSAMASKAARARTGRAAMARTIRSRLLRLSEAVEAGEMEPGRANSAAQILNYATATLKVERDLIETEELVREVEEMRRRVGTS